MQMYHFFSAKLKSVALEHSLRGAYSLQVHPERPSSIGADVYRRRSARVLCTFEEDLQMKGRLTEGTTSPRMRLSHHQVGCLKRIDVKLLTW